MTTADAEYLWGEQDQPPIATFEIDNGVTVADVARRCQHVLATTTSAYLNPDLAEKIDFRTLHIRALRLTHLALLTETAKHFQDTHRLDDAYRVPLPDPNVLLQAAQIYATLATTPRSETP